MQLVFDFFFSCSFSSITVHAGLCQTLSETPKTGFLASLLIIMTIKDEMKLTLNARSYSARIFLCPYSSRMIMSKQIHSHGCSKTPSEKVKYVLTSGL